MEKKQMLTGIFFIPTLHVHADRNVKSAMYAVVHQLGALNCEPDNTAAVIKYTGLLSKETKEILNKEAKNNGHRIAYIEVEYETPFADCDTFHIPTDDEMKEHLKLEEKVNHP